MAQITVIVSFELNNDDLLEDWKNLSTAINEDIKNAKGFISRDSLKSDNGKIFCVVKWNSKEEQMNFRKELEAREEWPNMMMAFSKIVNMSTMDMQIHEVL